jgi:tyrosyl-tRNA synthetase
LDFLREVGFIESNGEGRRLIKQNALKIDNKAYAQESIQLEAGKEYILKLGKLRMVKMVVQ